MGGFFETRDIWCVLCQKRTPHSFAVDGNGELIATCVCKHALKFPVGISLDELNGLIDLHHEHNQSVVTADMVAQSAKVADSATGLKQTIKDVVEGVRSDLGS